MKNTILFSDVHLKASGEDTAVHKSFLTFLQHIDPNQTERLICLGDLFDFWYEYRHVVFSGYFETLRTLADLNDAGVELHLICGNHDFWAGAFLEKNIGIQVHREPVRLAFGNKEALLLHGDGLNPRDYGYRLFKRIARSPIAIRLFRHIHPDTAMAIAQFMSRSSRTLAEASTPSEGPEAHFVREHAHHLLRDGTADIVICGHAHAPAIEAVSLDDKTGLYVNTGDWPNHRSYIVYEENDFHLRHFE
ncbi:MAG: UDP-2,3-diacylglucosamine diphosphatase [Candidatus Hydrogenedentes bacterium]|nr:UDP-2,3-diacylglucosamine diphosphatase [Candidatus Hydrogenedentota bacterium]